MDRIMRIELTILGCLAAAASAIACWLWQTKRKIVHRLADLTAQCEKAESDKAGLMRALSLRSHEETERISRLEHDVKSSLGVILGFSTLLMEAVEQDPRERPLPLKNIQAIRQAATKILQIVDAAVQGTNSRASQDLVVDGKN
jgi:signal transduction histidine kinase